MRLPLVSLRRVALVLAVCVGLMALGPTAKPVAAEKEAVTLKEVEYKGWKMNLRLSNGDVELIVTLDVGPRVISYGFKDGKNVFKEYADQLGKGSEKEWQIRGGHRLWVGPEDLTRTYEPDNDWVKYRVTESGLVVWFTPRHGEVGIPEPEYGLRKEIGLRLAEKGSRVSVIHRITNVGKAATELAPWALTVMAPGGVEIIPQPPKRPHPGSPRNARTPEDFAPTQTLILWPFFNFKDPRWTFGDKYVTLRQDSKRGPTKIGLVHELGWVAYLNEGTLFVKRIEYHKGKTYPDRGCNFETFTNEDMLEIESLGPLVKLEPNEAVELTEHWELFKDVEAITDEASIDKNVLPKIGK